MIIIILIFILFIIVMIMIIMIIVIIMIMIIMIINVIFVVAESTCLLAPISVPFALRALTSAALILTSSVRSFQFRWKCSFRAVWRIMIVMVVVGLAESTCLLAPVSVPPTVTTSTVGPLVPATTGRLGHFFWKWSMRADMRMIIMVVMVFAQSTCLLASISIPSAAGWTTATEFIMAIMGWGFIMIIMMIITTIPLRHGYG